jgi:hypothetical protein
MREVAGFTPGLDFYLLCEPICVSQDRQRGHFPNVEFAECMNFFSQ